jgi:hypothetical protein
MHSLPDSSDESEGAIVEEMRRALRKKKANTMEEAEGLLAPGGVPSASPTATANPMTVGPPGVLPGSPATVKSVGFDQGEEEENDGE